MNNTLSKTNRRIFVKDGAVSHCYTLVCTTRGQVVVSTVGDGEDRGAQGLDLAEANEQIADAAAIGCAVNSHHDDLGWAPA